MPKVSSRKCDQRHIDIKIQLVIHRPPSIDEGDTDPLVPTALELRLSTALISNCAHVCCILLFDLFFSSLLQIGEASLSPSTDTERANAASLLQRARSMHLVDDDDAAVWQKAIDGWLFALVNVRKFSL